MILENSWMFPALEAAHVIGLALLVGTIVLGDLRVLGWIAASVPDGMTRAGLWTMVITGIPLFLSGYERYRENPAFLVKMSLLLVALALHHTIHRRATRATAVLSLSIWTLVVVAARAVIDFDV
ncbi:MAG: hypothetical protein ABI995_06565 [Acidobacteriota bacterium]